MKYRRRSTRRFSRRFKRRTSYRRIYKKRRFHKRGRNNPNRVRVVRMRGTTAPDAMWQKFFYAEDNWRFDLGALDTMNVQTVCLNDPWDPYTGLGGKAANQFKKIMEQYKLCRVYGAKFTLKIVDNPEANQVPMNFGCVIDNPVNVTSYSSMDDVLSLPSNRVKILRSFTDRIGSTKKISFFVHLADANLMTRQQWNNMTPPSNYDVTNFGGISSPSNKVNCRIYYGRTDTTTQDAVISVRGVVYVKYYCKVWGRIEFGEAANN